MESAEKTIVTAHLALIRNSRMESPIRSAMLLQECCSEAEKSGRLVKVEIPGGRTGYISTNESEDYSTWKSSRRLTSENIEHTARLFMGVPYLWAVHRPRVWIAQDLPKPFTVEWT